MADGCLASELVKSEYSFALTETVDSNNERQIEAALVRNITRTLTELGGGFAYVGHQVRVNVDGEDFWLPLVLAQGSPIFHSSCEGELGVALESLQGKRNHIQACV